jgi:hypothetical protein
MLVTHGGIGGQEAAHVEMVVAVVAAVQEMEMVEMGMAIPEMAVIVMTCAIQLVQTIILTFVTGVILIIITMNPITASQYAIPVPPIMILQNVIKFAISFQMTTMQVFVMSVLVVEMTNMEMVVFQMLRV